MKTKIKPILRTDIVAKGMERRIDLRVLCQGKYSCLTTPYRVRPADWDDKQGRVKGNGIDVRKANKYLSEKINEFDSYLLKREANGNVVKITMAEIKAILKNEVIERPDVKREEKKQDDVPIEKIFDLYIDFLTITERRWNTLRNYKSYKRIVCRFAKMKYGKRVNISYINLEFARELRKYLQTTLKNKSGTVGKRMEGLRAVIRYAIYEGYNITDPFSRYENLIPSGQEKTIFLNTEEYLRFKRIKLSAEADPSVKLTHRLFMFSCETGLRYSDMQDLKWEHLIVKDGKYEALEKVQIKNRNRVHVPLSRQAVATILLNERNKIGKYVFDRIANQTMNRGLKLLAKEAEIDKDVTYHVSRHTFATNLANHGANEFEIAKLLGDRKLDVARIYVNNDAVGLKNVMTKVWQKQSDKTKNN